MNNPSHRVLQPSRVMLPSLFAKKQGKGVPIAIPTTERRAPSYQGSSSSSRPSVTLVTGNRDSSVFKKKSNLPHYGVSPTKSKAKVDHGDVMIVGTVPGYDALSGEQKKKTVLFESEGMDDDEQEGERPVKRKKIHETKALVPVGSLISRMKKDTSAPTTSSTTSSQTPRAVPYRVPTGFSSTSISRILPQSRLQSTSSLAKQEKSRTPLLSDKSKEPGSGVFPPIKAEEIKIGKELYHSAGMSIQFLPGKIIINLDKQATTIKTEELLKFKHGIQSAVMVLQIFTKSKLSPSSNLSKHYDPTADGMAKSIDICIDKTYMGRFTTWAKGLRPSIPTTYLSAPDDTKTASKENIKDVASDRRVSSSPSASPQLSPLSTPATSATPPHLSDRQSSPPPTRRFEPATKLFTYPFNNTGITKKITVMSEDLSRLDEDEFLNDTLIEFGLKYIHTNLEKSKPEVAHQTYIFNSFFYQKLASKPPTGKHCSYDLVKSWTNKVDLFSKKYIIIPIHENVHWYLAIITNPGLLLDRELEKATKSNQGRSHPAADLISDLGTASPLPSSPSSPTENGRAASINLDDLNDAPSPSDYMVNGILTRHKDGNESKVGGGAGESRVASPERVSKIGDVSKSLRSSLLKESATIKSGEAFPDEFSRMKLRSSSALPVDPEAKTCIIILDSLEGVHPRVSKTLRAYLQEELLARKKINKVIGPGNVLAKHATNCPKQLNHCDCGLYLMHYAEIFLKDPTTLLEAILNKSDSKTMWRESALSKKREYYKKIVLDLTDEYKALHEEPPSSPKT
ncbi:hypothetical protein BGZ83_009064 [Gryganskiella cystojenkinii]|nr:hypothetical protein BGZ83_009064 [Gryganskiella cystojenkinii]